MSFPWIMKQVTWEETVGFSRSEGSGQWARMWYKTLYPLSGKLNLFNFWKKKKKLLLLIFQPLTGHRTRVIIPQYNMAFSEYTRVKQETCHLIQ